MERGNFPAPLQTLFPVGTLRECRGCRRPRRLARLRIAQDLAGQAIFAHQPIIELRPILDPIGEPLVVDDDEQIVVGLVDVNGLHS